MFKYLKKIYIRFLVFLGVCLKFFREAASLYFLVGGLLVNGGPGSFVFLGGGCQKRGVRGVGGDPHKNYFQSLLLLFSIQFSLKSFIIS